MSQHSTKSDPRQDLSIAHSEAPTSPPRGARASRGKGDPERSRGLVRSGDRLYAPRAFEFVSDHRAEFAGKRMCRTLGVSTSGYYAWCQREPSTRSCADETLERRIMEIHQGSRGTYGVPRIHAELAADGVAIGRKRVSRLMRRAGIEGISRRGRAWTTRQDRDARPAPDLVERDFGAPGPDQLWVADITYVPTWAGFLYLAVVVDAWSRRCRCLGGRSKRWPKHTSSPTAPSWCSRRRPPIKLGERAVGWRADEINEWLDSRFIRGLLQSSTEALGTRLSLADRVRACAGSLSRASPGSTPCGAEFRKDFRKRIRENQP